MAHPIRATAALLTLSLVIAAAAPARGADVRLVSSDANGVTLRLDLDQWNIGPAESDGRSQITARGLRLLDLPGRPQLPYANTLIAVPDGAHISLSVLSTTPETHEGVHAKIGPRSALYGNGLSADYTSRIDTVAAVKDGPWPATDAAPGVPFELRGQRLVSVSLHPFHFDERTGRLVVYRSMTVRVAFSARAGSAGALPGGEDRFVEPVLKSAVLNYDQGRAFRIGRGGPSGGRLAALAPPAARARARVRRRSTKACPKCASRSTPPACGRSITTGSRRRDFRPRCRTPK